MSIPEELVIHTKLTGDRQTIAGLLAEAKAVRDLGVATELTGTAMDRTAKRGFLMNQALFTIRRFLYSGTLAVGAMTTAVTFLGIKFNANMEMNTVAMAHFLGSTTAAKNELNFLYELAAKTPFEFMQLTAAARQFLAFGFTLQETNKLLTSVGDTAAGLGVGADGINRIVLAFGQMRTAGRILGGELRQLQEVGIPASRYLKEAFNLSPQQMRSIGALGIPADIGLDVIIKGMQKDFGGAAAEQAKTFSGQISTLHDYASRLAGELTFPLFESLRTRLLPRMNTLISIMSDTLQRGEGFGAAIKALDANLTPQSHRVYFAFQQLRGITLDLIRIYKGLWKAWTDNAAVLVTLLAVLVVVRSTLAFLAHTTWLWVPILKIVIALLILKWTKLIGLRIAYYALGKAIIWNTRMTRLNAIADKIAAGAMGALRVATFGYIRGANGQFVAMTRLQKLVLRLRIAFISLTGAMLTNPFVLIGIGIALLVAGLVILFFKWDAFHDKVISLWEWIKRNWPYLAGALLGPFGLAGVFIMKNFDAIRDKLSSFFGWVWGKMKWLADKVGWLLSKIPGAGGGRNKPWWQRGALDLLGVPGFAGGGATPWSGNFMVGERGPEMVTLPAGSNITSNDQLSPVFSMMESWMNRPGGQSSPQVIKLQVDGRTLAEVVVDNLRAVEATS